MIEELDKASVVLRLGFKRLGRWRAVTHGAPRDWFAHVRCSHCKWRHLVIVHGVLWLVPLYCRLCRVFSRSVSRAVCRKCSKFHAVYSRWRAVLQCCVSVHFGREKSRTKLERNGVTLNFPVFIRYRIVVCKNPSEACRERGVEFHRRIKNALRAYRSGTSSGQYFLDFWRAILSMLEPTSRTPPPTDKMVAPPICNGLGALFSWKSTRKSSAAMVSWQNLAHFGQMNPRVACLDKKYGL